MSTRIKKPIKPSEEMIERYIWQRWGGVFARLARANELSSGEKAQTQTGK